jgi:hypothetical protein
LQQDERRDGQLPPKRPPVPHPSAIGWHVGGLASRHAGWRRWVGGFEENGPGAPALGRSALGGPAMPGAPGDLQSPGLLALRGAVGVGRCRPRLSDGWGELASGPASDEGAAGSCGPLGSHVEVGLDAVVEQEQRLLAMDGACASMGLDQFGLQLVVEVLLLVEAKDASGAEGRADVGPGVSERCEDVAVSPLVEATLSAEVAQLEVQALGQEASEFEGEQLGQSVEGGAAIDAVAEGSAELVEGLLQGESDGPVGEQADALSGEPVFASVLDLAGEVAESAAQLLGLGRAVVMDEVAASGAGPVDVPAQDARSVADVEGGGVEGGAEGRGEGVGVSGGVEEGEGATGPEEGASFAAPASAVREEPACVFVEGVEEKEGLVRGVGGFGERA